MNVFTRCHRFESGWNPKKKGQKLRTAVKDKRQTWQLEKRGRWRRRSERNGGRCDEMVKVRTNSKVKSEVKSNGRDDSVERRQAEQSERRRRRIEIECIWKWKQSVVNSRSNCRRETTEWGPPIGDRFRVCNIKMQIVNATLGRRDNRPNDRPVSVGCGQCHSERSNDTRVVKVVVERGKFADEKWIRAKRKTEKRKRKHP